MSDCKDCDCKARKPRRRYMEVFALSCVGALAGGVAADFGILAGVLTGTIFGVFLGLCNVFDP